MRLAHDSLERRPQVIHACMHCARQNGSPGFVLLAKVVQIRNRSGSVAGCIVSFLFFSNPIVTLRIPLDMQHVLSNQPNLPFVWLSVFTYEIGCKTGGLPLFRGM